jgi:hypothetical protein
MFRTSTFLRLVLLADAITCTATGLMMMIGSDALEQSLGLPAALLRYAGFSLLPFAVFLLYLAARQQSSASPVWAAILLNALWTVDSLLILVTGWVAPTEVGYVLVIAQALGVAMLAALEYVGLRKSLTATV